MPRNVSSLVGIECVWFFLNNLINVSLMWCFLPILPVTLTLLPNFESPLHFYTLNLQSDISNTLLNSDWSDNERVDFSLADQFNVSEFKLKFS